MNTPKYIIFNELHVEGRKTKVWQVWTKDKQFVLGHVKWFGRWRRYAFYPEPETIFEQTCLRDLADFCEERTQEHRLERKFAREDSFHFAGGVA